MSDERTQTNIDKASAKLIEAVYGNIRIEHPEITREQVAQRLAMSIKARAEPQQKEPPCSTQN